MEDDDSLPTNNNNNKQELAYLSTSSTVASIRGQEGGMMSSFVKLCGQGAPIASVGLYLAPLPTIQQIVASGTVGSLPLLPYSTMASNAFLWTTYGFMKEEPRVWSCNGIGFLVALYYCLRYVQAIPKHKNVSILDASTPTLPGTVKQHVQGVVAVLLATMFLALTKPFRQNTANLIGNTAVLFCILMFASPLSVIKLVLQTKSAKSIPLPFTVVSCLNCFMWVIFGWFELNDVNIYLPNMLGLTFGIIQVVLKVVFKEGGGGNDTDLPSFAAGLAP